MKKTIFLLRVATAVAIIIAMFSCSASAQTAGTILAIKSPGEVTSQVNPISYQEFLALEIPGSSASSVWAFSEDAGPDPNPTMGSIPVTSNLVTELFAAGASQEEVLEATSTINPATFAEKVLDHFGAGQSRGENGYYFYLGISFPDETGTEKFHLVEIWRSQAESEPENQVEISVLYNSVTETFNLQSDGFDQGEMVNITIFDAQGRVVLEKFQTGFGNPFPVSLPSGTYLASVYVKNNNRFGKLKFPVIR